MLKYITVHPHPRGESRRHLQCKLCDRGSPPPAWGKRRSSGKSRTVGRFTPTRVGKAPVQRQEPHRRAVHPHPRGESSMSLILANPYPGSPPPAWGKRWKPGRAIRRPGFTPTRVGKAAAVGVFVADNPVHPHPRGESRCGPELRPPESGSPPPAWGKRTASTYECEASLDSSGSPPPAWGKRGQAHAPVLYARFTPTRVGKAARGPNVEKRFAVHPHPRGESSWANSGLTARSGSPPPAWGKPSTVYSRIANND